MVGVLEGGGVGLVGDVAPAQGVNRIGSSAIAGTPVIMASAASATGHIRLIME